MTPQWLFLIISLFVLSLSGVVQAQDNTGYKTPPKDITDMLLPKPTPNVSIDEKGEGILITEISRYPSVIELAKPELRIAGMLINPANWP